VQGQAGSKPEANCFGTGWCSIILWKSHPVGNVRQSDITSSQDYYCAYGIHDR